MSEQQSNPQGCELYTPEPWVLDGDDITAEHLDGTIIAQTCGGNYFCEINKKANARRIIACVNALAGVSTETLEILIAQGNGKYALNVEATQAKVKKLEAQRDELLNALSPFSKYACDSYAGDSPCACYNCIARDLIAKIEAEKNKNG